MLPGGGAGLPRDVAALVGFVCFVVLPLPLVDLTEHFIWFHFLSFLSISVILIFKLFERSLYSLQYTFSTHFQYTFPTAFSETVALYITLILQLICIIVSFHLYISIYIQIYKPKIHT